MHPAGRALIGLWAGLALLAGGGALVLWRLGPPQTVKPAGPVVARAVTPPVAGLPDRPGPAAGITADASVEKRPGMAIGKTVVAGPAATPAQTIAISPPLPALVEPSVDFPDRTLPIVAADGRSASTTYAAHAGLPASGPQVAILLEGVGLSEDLDRTAAETLPPQISFAVSPYADALARPNDTPLLDQARREGHELWLSLPMEPAGSPADTEGAQALSLGIDLALDRKAMLWSLSRFPGYVGVTNALGGLRGDRFASSSQFAMVANELGQRGLSYVDAGLAPHEAPAIVPPRTRHADLTIDESPNATDIQASLTRLEALAQANGSALGIAGPIRPVTVERLRAWSRGLRERGIALVPVSALPPPSSSQPARNQPGQAPSSVSPTPQPPSMQAPALAPATQMAPGPADGSTIPSTQGSANQRSAPRSSTSDAVTTEVLPAQPPDRTTHAPAQPSQDQSSQDRPDRSPHT